MNVKDLAIQTAHNELADSVKNLMIANSVVKATNITSADAETKTEIADHPCYHVTVYSPEIEKVGYGSARHPKYTITVESFNELIPISSARDYKLLQIPLGDGRFELVSTSMVEIEYY